MINKSNQYKFLVRPQEISRKRFIYDVVFLSADMKLINIRCTTDKNVAEEMVKLLNDAVNIEKIISK